MPLSAVDLPSVVGRSFLDLFTLANDPASEIIDTAVKHGCDIIFMASHGHHGIQRLILGSVTQKVLAHSDIPVLVSR